MKTVLRYSGQAVVYGLFFAMVGYFSTSPAYVHLPPDEAVIKLSFSHPGKPVGECRERSDEELSRLAPNMRVRRVCPRERSPLRVSLELDGRALYQAILPPSGLNRDGVAIAYKRLAVKAGPHRIRVRLKDRVGGGADDYDYEKVQEVTLRPAEVLVIDFSQEAGGFVFKQPALKTKDGADTRSGV